MSEGAVQITVQVVDEQPRNLVVSLPTYLPAPELARRLARDAGLERGVEIDIWSRGRRLDATDTLGSIGVVAGELVHVLPRVPGSGRDRSLPGPPAVPSVSRAEAVAWSVAFAAGVVGWALSWPATDTPWLAWLPAMALSVVAWGVSWRWFVGSRSVWGGAVTLSCLAVGVGALSALGPLGLQGVGMVGALGAAGAGVGLVIASLAVPVSRSSSAPAFARGLAADLPVCGLCGQLVAAEVRVGCPHGACGAAFHSGCAGAHRALAHDTCPHCGAEA